MARQEIRLGNRLDHILGKIDEDRSRTPRTGDLKRLPDRPVQVFDPPDEEVVLRAGPGDAGDVHLLETVAPDDGGGDLPGEDDDGDRIHVGVGNPGHRVGGAGPGSHQADADPPRHAGVSVGGMNGTLFMAHQDMADILPEELVIDIHDASPRITEEGIDVFFL